MKENLINLKNQLIESQKNNSEPGYVFVNVNDSLVNGDTHYSEEYYNNMIVPANIAAYKVIKYYESQLENHKKLKHTTSDKVDLEIGIEVVVKGKTYEAEKRKHYKYEDMVVIAPYAFTDLGSKEDRIYLEDVIVPEEERVKKPYMAVNYEEFFKEMKDYGYDFGASTYVDLLTRFKNSEYIYDIWDDKILNPSLSIEASKQKKLM